CRPAGTRSPARSTRRCTECWSSSSHDRLDRSSGPPPAPFWKGRGCRRRVASASALSPELLLLQVDEEGVALAEVRLAGQRTRRPAGHEEAARADHQAKGVVVGRAAELAGPQDVAGGPEGGQEGV